MDENKNVDVVKDATGAYKPNPLKSLASESKKYQEDFINNLLSQGLLPRSYTFDQADRIYKNQQLRDKIGQDKYDVITNPNSGKYLPAEQRDEYYDWTEYSKAISEKYAGDSNLGFYEDLTTEGLKDLWSSGIKSEKELEEEKKALNKTRKSNEENKYEPKSKLGKAIFAAADAAKDAGTGTGEFDEFGIQDVANAIKLRRGLITNDEEREKVENQLNSKVQNITDKASGTMNLGRDDEDVDKSIERLYESNFKKIEDLRMREDTRILNLPGVQDEVTRRSNLLYDKVNNGETSLEELKETFKKVFDNDEKEEASGSRYYTGYKNKSELSDFSVDDMVKTLAEFSVLSEASGNSARAMQIIDTQMFNRVKNNQNWFKRRGNTVAGIGTKALSMLMNETFGGYVDLIHAWRDNPEDYQKYKTAEDVLQKGGLSYLMNPNFWNYADQYATLNPYEISRINHNAGIGGNVNLYSPTGKMTAEQFIDESVKMVGYMLPAAAISFATRKVPRGSAWQKLIGGAELFGSAAALGSAYSTGVYNNIVLGADQALDKMFQHEAGDFIEQYYKSNPNYVADYFKRQGIKQDDADILTIPTKIAAEKQLYEDAKQAYFNSLGEEEKKKRLAIYEDARQQKLKDAQTGAFVDDIIETVRMCFSGATWGRWTKSQLTRDLLKRGYNPIQMAGHEATQAARKTFRRGAAGMAMLSGGVDNYLDDITAGIGKGLGLSKYDNYLASLYDPEATIEGAKKTATLVEGIALGMQGAIDAYYEPQTWIDGAIGAAGSVFGGRFNALTLISDAIHKEGKFSKYADTSTEAGKQAQKEWNEMTKLQKWSRYVTNGIVSEMADADAKYLATQKHIQKLNNTIVPNYLKEIQQLGDVVKENIDFNLVADNIKDAKDIKQIGMLKSIIRQLDGMRDPVLAQLPEVAKFADYLNRGRKGQFTDAEIESYLNEPNNISTKNAVDSEGNDISKQKAVEAMQKNVDSILKMAKRYNKFADKVSRNMDFSVLNTDAKTQIAVQLALKETWQERFDSMLETLGKRGTEKAIWNYDAEFGTEAGRERVIGALEKLVNKNREETEKAKARYDVAEEAYKQATTEEEKELAFKELTARRYVFESQRDEYLENVNLLKQKKHAKTNFDENGKAPLLEEADIMRLSPIQTARMLNPDNYRDYSEEQVGVIKRLAEKLKTNIDEEGNIRDLYQMALDAGEMQERVNASDKSIREVAKHPAMLKDYARRLKDRQKYMLIQASADDTRRDQLEKLDAIQTPEEAVEVIFRGKYPAETVDKGFYMPAEVVNEYVKNHPEAKEKFAKATDMVQTLDDMYRAAESIFTPTEAVQIKETIASATKNTNSKEEMLSSLEDVIDKQDSAEAKLQYDRILEKMRSYGYQRDATKLRDRATERQKKQEAEIARLNEEAKKDGKNYNWDGYKVGDTVYNKETGSVATVVGFETNQDGSNKMILEMHRADGKIGRLRYDSVTGKDKLTKEKPVAKPTETKSTESKPVETKPVEVKQESPVVEVGPLADVVLDENGATESPEAAQQGEEVGTTVVDVPETDVTDQGNAITDSAENVLPGNKYVEYSIEKLKDGIIEEEVPERNDSIFGRFRDWLSKTGTKLQEIIDEEFSKILQDNPDIDIKFMVVKTKSGDNLGKILFNVIEATPEVLKYHDDSRGGVFNANGKTWLVVGTTGFQNTEQAKAFNTTRGSVNKRALDYFKVNVDAEYYVDPTAYTRVQNTTSGRIVNQKLGEQASRKKLSELLKSAKMTLKDAIFGIQTDKSGIKSFALSKKIDRSKVYPPRNLEDNKGRTFIMIETANGNYIPGMIEPAMYSSLPQGSKLKDDIINPLIADLTSSNYEIRRNAISQLKGYLFLDKNGKNILIGTKDVNVITITVPNVETGKPDEIKFKLGRGFDMVGFFDAITNANFQLNVTLESLMDPDMLKLYDDAGVLMTSVASMNTAGMSYTVYPTDINGKPVITIPRGNSVPGTGSSEFRVYNSVRVNNTTYEYRDGQFIDRDTKQPIDMTSDLGRSCLYNKAINDGQGVFITSRAGKKYYSMPAAEGTDIVIARDGLGNIEVLSQEESKKLNDALLTKQENKLREKNLEEVNLYEGKPEREEPINVEKVNFDDINKDIIGELEKPVEEVKSTTPEVKETKEIKSQQPKEVISDVGTKSFEDLQKSENLSTFEQIAASDKYGDRLYRILDSKGWEITGALALDAEILAQHDVSLVGIKNVEDWLNMIKNCK